MCDTVRRCIVIIWCQITQMISYVNPLIPQHSFANNSLNCSTIGVSKYPTVTRFQYADCASNWLCENDFSFAREISHDDVFENN